MTDREKAFYLNIRANKNHDLFHEFFTVGDNGEPQPIKGN